MGENLPGAGPGRIVRQDDPQDPRRVPFRARSISSSTQDEPSAVLRALGMLIAERVPVDLAQLYPEGRLTEDESGPVTRIPVGRASFGRMPLMPLAPPIPRSDGFREAPDDGHRPSKGPSLVPLPLDSGIVAAELSEAVRAAETTIQAHEAFLRAAQRTQELAQAEYARQQELIRSLTDDGRAVAVGGPPIPAVGTPIPSAATVPIARPSAGTLAMDRDQLMEFRDRIGRPGSRGALRSRGRTPDACSSSGRNRSCSSTVSRRSRQNPNR